MFHRSNGKLQPEILTKKKPFYCCCCSSMNEIGQTNTPISILTRRRLNYGRWLSAKNKSPNCFFFCFVFLHHLPLGRLSIVLLHNIMNAINSSSLSHCCGFNRKGKMCVCVCVGEAITVGKHFLRHENLSMSATLREPPFKNGMEVAMHIVAIYSLLHHTERTRQIGFCETNKNAQYVHSALCTQFATSRTDMVSCKCVRNNDFFSVA